MAISLSRQLEQIERQIEDRLGKDGLEPIGELISELGAQKVRDEVYNAYFPIEYERTYQLENSWKMNKTRHI